MGLAFDVEIGERRARFIAEITRTFIFTRRASQILRQCVDIARFGFDARIREVADREAFVGVVGITTGVRFSEIFFRARGVTPRRSSISRTNRIVTATRNVINTCARFPNLLKRIQNLSDRIFIWKNGVDIHLRMLFDIICQKVKQIFFRFHIIINNCLVVKTQLLQYDC